MRLVEGTHCGAGNFSNNNDDDINDASMNKLFALNSTRQEAGDSELVEHGMTSIRERLRECPVFSLRPLGGCKMARVGPTIDFLLRLRLIGTTKSFSKSPWKRFDFPSTNLGYMPHVFRPSEAGKRFKSWQIC